MFSQCCRPQRLKSGVHPVDFLSFQLGITFLNLMIGLLIGWYAYRKRGGTSTVRAKQPQEGEVLSLLDEIRDAMTDQVDNWDALQSLIAKTPNPSADDLGLHLRTNRLYGRLLKSYGSQLTHVDPQRRIVPHELTEYVEARRNEIGTLTDAIEQAELSPGNESLKNLASRLSQLEQSNLALREELNAAQTKISEQTVKLRDAEAAALHDHLTELPNRRAFDEHLFDLETKFQIQNQPFCLMMLDLDHFKQLNDSHGHDAGDAVLKVAARIMRETSREGDIVCRYGGEEFAVLAPDTCLADAAELAEEIRKNMERMRVRFGQVHIRATCSIGLAEMTSEFTRDELVRSADEALYFSKQSGRNVIHVYPLARVVTA